MYELNRAVLSQVKGLRYRAALVAPDTFEELQRHIGELVVYSGDSDKTIYGDSRVNLAFRAWHDRLHLRLQTPFTLEGETLVARYQANRLGGVLGDIIMAEVVGQAEYFKTHGSFPVDQSEFMRRYLVAKFGLLI